MSNPYSIQKQVTLQFPQPPEGERWHNPEGLSPEQVSEGFRLLTSGEVAILVKKSSAEAHSLEVQVCYNAKYSDWFWDSGGGVTKHFTYRVPDTTPIVTNQLKYNPNKFYAAVDSKGRRFILAYRNKGFDMVENPCAPDGYEFSTNNSFDGWTLWARIYGGEIKEFNSLLKLATWMASGK